ncbi:hypothetical protein BX661DRAFT_173311 [Kickxella alabastrina]|uniref:uncharacterized protein n=1 Tax=Kickxella alabastrina TaxID=61397 RepID=UPI0022201504|nr:uncharacterized protein BX661DRAFT_173311 [Kickxella alabastrina]KAI7821428.1 hypothetical protein BX661DRAFT_173311 [Kickxella alabastrina]
MAREEVDEDQDNDDSNGSEKSIAKSNVVVRKTRTVIAHKLRTTTVADLEIQEERSNALRDDILDEDDADADATLTVKISTLLLIAGATVSAEVFFNVPIGLDRNAVKAAFLEHGIKGFNPAAQPNSRANSSPRPVHEDYDKEDEKPEGQKLSNEGFSARSQGSSQGKPVAVPLTPTHRSKDNVQPAARDAVKSNPAPQALVIANNAPVHGHENGCPRQNVPRCLCSPTVGVASVATPNSMVADSNIQAPDSGAGAGVVGGPASTNNATILRMSSLRGVEEFSNAADVAPAATNTVAPPAAPPAAPVVTPPLLQQLVLLVLLKLICCSSWGCFQQFCIPIAPIMAAPIILTDPAAPVMAGPIIHVDQVAPIATTPIPHLAPVVPIVPAVATTIMHAAPVIPIMAGATKAAAITAVPTASGDSKAAHATGVATSVPKAALTTVVASPLAISVTLPATKIASITTANTAVATAAAAVPLVVNVESAPMWLLMRARLCRLRRRLHTLQPQEQQQQQQQELRLLLALLMHCHGIDSFTLSNCWSTSVSHAATAIDAPLIGSANLTSSSSSIIPTTLAMDEQGEAELVEPKSEITKLSGGGVKLKPLMFANLASATAFKPDDLDKFTFPTASPLVNMNGMTANINEKHPVSVSGGARVDSGSSNIAGSISNANAPHSGFQGSMPGGKSSCCEEHQLKGTGCTDRGAEAGSARDRSDVPKSKSLSIVEDDKDSSAAGALVQPRKFSE